MKHQTKPIIMVLGSGHLANPGMDGILKSMQSIKVI